VSPAEQRTQSSLYDERQNGWQWTWSNVLSYVKSAGDHSINAIVGVEAQNAYFDNVNVTGYNVLNDPNQYYIGAAKEANFSAGSGVGHSSLLSEFARLNYSFRDKYLATATIRRDASSRFTEQNRVGYFPSFSLGWNVHEEPFFQGQQFVSSLKARAGYGEVGNQSVISTTATNYVVVPQQRYSFGGVPVEGRANTTLVNTDLVWETSQMTNFGIDAGFLDNRLALTLEYFVKKTSDLLVATPPVPAYVGALPPAVNAGTMQNKGLEVALNYSKKEGGFHYDLGVNAAFIRNEVLKLAGGQPVAAGEVNRLGATTRTQEGEVFASFYGRKTDGIFNSQEEVNAYTKDGQLIQPLAKPGDVKFVDLNQDGKIDDLDRTILGSAIPDFNYGINAFFDYKNFDLKVFFQGLVGNETVNALSVFNASPRGNLNSYAFRMNRWTPENLNADEPRMTQSDPNQNIAFSDRYVEDGSYLRLRNLQLGYTLPASVLSRAGVKGLRVYVSADNLLTFTDYRGFEPEVGDWWGDPFYQGVDVATYPQARTIIGGFNVTF
jgi:TonB-linked SusC/RagA family outer membrane protein